MSEKPAQKLSESDDFTDNSVDNANDAAREDTSQQSGLATVESEYDTASDSPSDGEEYDDQEEDSDSQEEEELVTDGEEGEDDEEDDDGSDDDVIEVLDNERQSGDGQEQETDSKRKVDDDEDRSNPQYIPKKGTFYEHDDRTLEDEEDGKAGDESLNSEDPVGPGGDRKVDKNAVSKATKKWQASADRWTHDRFDESEQAPKSRAELVSAYGYDIRSEDGPPRARRRRRYARGPNRYTRNWEDEDAYSKSNVVDHNRQRKVPRPEEFPELGTNNNSISGSGKLRQNGRRSSKQLLRTSGERDELAPGRPQRAERRTSERSRGSNGNRGSMGDRDRDRGAERDRNDRYEQPRPDRERNWDRDRDYDQHGMDNYRDGRNDGSRYSSERMANNNSYHNKENKISNRGSKEKDRRGSDYKVITSLQFKNQTRNKAMEGGGMPITGGSGGVNQVVHSNSAGALSGSSNSNKMNNAMDRVQPMPDRMLDQRAVQHHYQNQPPQMMQQPQQQQQAIPHQQQQMPPPPHSQVQQAQPQPQPQQIQHHQQQQASYVNDDHYDSYNDSKMPKDAKFPYNPPANATIQSVEIGQTDIAKYPTPAGQRTSKDRQPVLSSTSAVAMNTRSQISPRQIVSTQASQLTSIAATQQLTHQQQQIQQQQPQQPQYQLQQQTPYQQLHPLTTQSGPPTATQAPQTQVPPPQLQQQQAPVAAQMHNVHMGASAVGQQQLLANDSNSRSSKRYSSTRQRSTLDNPNVVVVQSPLHEQQQQQLLQQQQQQQLLLQQELHQQQQKLSSQAPKQNYQINQPSLPLNLPNDYLVANAAQPAAVSKSQPTGQYQHPAAYYSATTPTGSEFVAGTPTQPVPVQQQPAVPVVPQQQNPLYQQYTAPSPTASHQYIQAPPPATYIPQTTTTPQPTPPTAPAAPPPQMMNYVPTIPPAAPAQYPAAPYTGYQNFNTVVPQPVTPAVPLTPPQPAAAAVYPSGITYYAPQSQTQTPRPLPSQRRPTSAIPILAPPERKSKNNRPGGSDNNSGSGPSSSISETAEDTSVSAAGPAATTAAPAAAASDIDHILDNMFVQRPVFQPPIRKSPSPAPTAATTGTASGTSSTPGAVPVVNADATMTSSDALKTAADVDSLDKIGESVKKLTIQEEKLPLVDAAGPEKLEIAPTVAPVDPTAG